MDREQKTLISELTQGKEHTEQLRKHLTSLSSPETRQFLVEKILSSYEKALSILNWETKPSISALESPHSCANSSPRSEISDQEFQRDVYKKRKTQPRWTEQVKVCSGMGLEGPLDDGYNWRKYGQKDILGANFPRGYYRCTHRHSQGCLATKQVQRSDQAPTIFEVTYRGRHPCFQAARLAASINDKSQQGEDNCLVERQQQHEEGKPKLLKEISFNYREGLSKSDDLEIFPPFSLNEENDIFKESIMENDFFVNFSPAFISPATSSGFGIDNNARTPESDSAPTSVTNSPIGDWDLSIDNVDFDSNLPLELFA
ncbi:hypothetical protein JCGZ_14353 [Jatropha curcas]|uniref:WRKY transcription factor 51.1 n=1 Tax=Jatropha curcas TaxID=180498 RepID=S5CKC9_JATCU|nr:WRKY transcription factor 51.1 [Jatropha curcas]KDP28582.1 hypothetical protein JCGZ_14353 [Jatropha curcas]